MAHEAGLYNVRVRKKYSRKESEPRLLGDFDEQGTPLIKALAQVMEDDFQASNQDGSRSVTCESAKVEGNELLLMVGHGETGLVQDIRDALGDPQYHQKIDDTAWVRCGCLFRLPPNQRVGALVVHVNSGRGVKGILTRGIEERFRELYTDVTLDIRPVVAASVFDEAVEQDMIGQVTLTRYVRPQDKFVDDTSKWVKSNESARFKLVISAATKEHRLMSRLLKRYKNDKSVFSEIVEFGGLEFEKAKVEVVLPDEKRRTFNIESPDKGHAITEDLTDLDLDEEDRPTEDSLFAGLRAVANDVAQAG